MKLSTAIERYKRKGLKKAEAIEKVKALLKKNNKRWTTKVAEFFDKHWRKRYPAPEPPVEIQKLKGETMHQKVSHKREKYSGPNANGNRLERIAFFKEQLPKLEETLEGVYCRIKGVSEHAKLTSFEKTIKKLGFKPVSPVKTEQDRTETWTTRYYRDQFQNTAFTLRVDANKPENSRCVFYINVHHDRNTWILSGGPEKAMQKQLKLRIGK